VRSEEKRVVTAAAARRFAWDELTDDELLDLRLSDLPLRIEGTPLEERVVRLYAELEERGLRFRPHVWLSQEWFSPDGVPGFAIPFYLAHPRLMKLERKQMLEIEGGTDKDCMQIMRHETGHALDNAYLFRRRKSWRDLFGPFALAYPDSYMPDATSRDYVLHLGAWYAQAHPAEDFAETFAVWLASPRPIWRRRYLGWYALKKLEYVHRLMEEASGKPMKNVSRRYVEPLNETKMTLREHYRRKRAKYGFTWTSNFDRDLTRIFSNDPRHANRLTAVKFLRTIRREMIQRVAEGTGVHHYTIDQLFLKLIERCKHLRLRVSGRKDQAKELLLVTLTVQTMNVVHTGYSRIAL
jgi:hypothetical protein